MSAQELRLERAAAANRAPDMEQRKRVVEKRAGSPMEVVASAGSGKTSLVVARIVHMVDKEGVEPSRIAAVTFTNKATAELRERLVRELGARGEEVRVSTIHSLCAALLRSHPMETGVRPGFEQLEGDEEERRAREVFSAVIDMLLGGTEHVPVGGAGVGSGEGAGGKTLLEALSAHASSFSPGERLVCGELAGAEAAPRLFPGAASFASRLVELLCGLGDAAGAGAEDAALACRLHRLAALVPDVRAFDSRRNVFLRYVLEADVHTVLLDTTRAMMRDCLRELEGFEGGGEGGEDVRGGGGSCSSSTEDFLQMHERLRGKLESGYEWIWEEIAGVIRELDSLLAPLAASEGGNWALAQRSASFVEGLEGLVELVFGVARKGGGFSSSSLKRLFHHLGKEAQLDLLHRLVEIQRPLLEKVVRRWCPDGSGAAARPGVFDALANVRSRLRALHELYAGKGGTDALASGLAAVLAGFTDKNGCGGGWQRRKMEKMLDDLEKCAARGGGHVARWLRAVLEEGESSPFAVAAERILENAGGDVSQAVDTMKNARGGLVPARLLVQSVFALVFPVVSCCQLVALSPLGRLASMVDYTGALALAAAAHVFFVVEKRRAGLLSFLDLLELASDAAARGLFSPGPFECILVDEFQDTDPLQAKLVFHLTDERHVNPGALDRRPASWELCRPKRGSLLVVGDPKQSIYRFRRADPVVGRRASRVLAEAVGGKEPVRLSACFRSVPELTAWIDALFGGKKGVCRPLMEDLSPYSPPYDPLHPVRPPLEGGETGASRGGCVLRGVYSYLPPSVRKNRMFEWVKRLEKELSESSKRKGRKRRRRDGPEPPDLKAVLAGFKAKLEEKSADEPDDCRYAAALVADLVRSGRGRLVDERRAAESAGEAGASAGERDVSDSFSRPIQPGDFLLVSWNKDDLPSMLSALRRAGFEVDYAGVNPLAFSRVARTLGLLLQGVLEPFDVLGLFLLARSPLFGYDDAKTARLLAEELEERRVGGEELPPPGSRGMARLMRDALREVEERCRLWGREFAAFPLFCALERVMVSSGFCRAAAGARMPGWELEDLVRFLGWARERLGGGASLAELVSLFGEVYGDGKYEWKAPPLRGEPSGGRIRLMNLHKAKGLEAPVVLLFGGLAAGAGEVNLVVLRGLDELDSAYDRAVRGGPESADADGGKDERGDGAECWERIERPASLEGLREAAMIVGADRIGKLPEGDYFLRHDQKFSDYEKVRLAYVGLTRAADALVLQEDSWVPAPLVEFGAGCARGAERGSEDEGLDAAAVLEQVRSVLEEAAESGKPGEAEERGQRLLAERAGSFAEEAPQWSRLDGWRERLEPPSIQDSPFPPGCVEESAGRADDAGGEAPGLVEFCVRPPEVVVEIDVTTWSTFSAGGGMKEAADAVERWVAERLEDDAGALRVEEFELPCSAWFASSGNASLHEAVLGLGSREAEEGVFGTLLHRVCELSVSSLWSGGLELGTGRPGAGKGGADRNSLVRRAVESCVAEADLLQRYLQALVCGVDAGAGAPADHPEGRGRAPRAEYLLGRAQEAVGELERVLERTALSMLAWLEGEVAAREEGGRGRILEVGTEMPLSVRIDASSGPHGGVVLKGVVDLALRTSSGWWLVDYKTVPPGRRRRRRRAKEGPPSVYERQLRAYAAMWKHVVGRVPSRAILLVAIAGETGLSGKEA